LFAWSLQKFGREIKVILREKIQNSKPDDRPAGEGVGVKRVDVQCVNSGKSGVIGGNTQVSLALTEGQTSRATTSTNNHVRNNHNIYQMGCCACKGTKEKGREMRQNRKGNDEQEW
jgi:hypothetical protein